MISDLAAKTSVWFARPAGYLLGAAEARLLEAIEKAGSIKEGAEAAAMSYRTAWARVREMERVLGRPVVHSRAGGPGGGATTLTDDARGLVSLFHELDTRVTEHARREFVRAIEPKP
ncbi:MAG TPA: LysR family transcriptional regulator [Gemmatimonadales bacterium]|jgi:molybdate transport system regulatory protein|nr:LysR family transcriptional regulator [Gemmatimonadales bacterium]